jgi:hypothetical protein
MKRGFAKWVLVYFTWRSTRTLPVTTTSQGANEVDTSERWRTDLRDFRLNLALPSAEIAKSAERDTMPRNRGDTRTLATHKLEPKRRGPTRVGPMAKSVLCMQRGALECQAAAQTKDSEDSADNVVAPLARRVWQSGFCMFR